MSQQSAPHPRMHGLTHVLGGPDPVPGMLPGTGVAQLPSLIGYWPLDDSGPPAHDYSVSAHHLSEKQPANPPTWGQPGPFADHTSVEFGRPSGFAVSTDALIDNVSGDIYQFDAADPYTWEIRFYPTALETTREAGLMGVYRYPDGSPNGMQITYVDTGVIRVWRAGLHFDSPEALTLNEWIHIAVSYDGEMLRLYLDGAEVMEAMTSAPHSASGSLQLGAFEDGTWIGNLKGRLAEAAIFNEALTPGQIFQHASGGVSGSVPEGWILGVDENGNPVWLPPGEVTVNGDDLPNSNTPLPPFTDLPEDPTEIDPSLQWMMEQPFTWNGPDFQVPPRKWTTIPFTQPLMERQSNVTGGSTTWFELDWDDPSSAGWVDPATPRVLTIPHDMPFFSDVYSWMQICLKLEVPAVEPETLRALRIFETTHQKPLVVSGTSRSYAGLGSGGLSVFRDPTAHGLAHDGAMFASGDTGGFGSHGNIMFVPSSGAGYYLSGFDWLPRVGGVATLKKGMRLVPQVWHEASVTLTMSCSGVWPYRPHFVLFTPGQRAWGPPWSEWPEYES